MTVTRLALIVELNNAAKSDNYRQLQAALKSVRAAGWKPEVKLNSKKCLLVSEALRLRNLIMESIKTENEQRVKDEESEWYEKERQWDKRNKERQERYNEAKRNRNKHQYGWSESERRMYEEWQQRRKQQQTRTDVQTPAQPHQKFIQIFQQRLGNLYTAFELKKVYKELAKVHHPDAGGSKEDFQALQRAYEVMK